MRSFKSYVKANPNDAVPTFRSVPEVTSFLSDISKEVSSLEKKLNSKDCDSDAFFVTYASLQEKQAILTNIRVLTSRDNHLNCSKVGTAAKVLRKRIIESTHAALLGRSVPDKEKTVSNTLTDLANKVQCTKSSVFALEGDSKSGGDLIHVLRLFGVRLSNGSSYAEYDVLVRSTNGKKDVSCGFSLPHLVGASSMYFVDTPKLKDVSTTILSMLEDDGLMITKRAFSLQPKERTCIKSKVFSLQQ